MRISITQGRLVPSIDGKIQTFPAARWRDEFDLCRLAGFDSIEWVHSGDGPEIDPIVSGDVSEIRDAISRTGVNVNSVCHDALLDIPIFEESGQRELWPAHWESLRIIAVNLDQLGGAHIVLPLLGANRVVSATGREAALEFIRGSLKALDGTNIELHLETSLRSTDLKSLMQDLNDSRCKITFDTGNILQFGYDLQAELEDLDGRIGSIHFKDSKLAGTTVPLGTGDVDFAAVAAYLRRVNFRGSFTLQGARVPGRDDFELCCSYLRFLNEQVNSES
jgi:L-ribulose-5-phosphate 3-epimerase